MIYQLDSLRQTYAGRTVLEIDRLEVREGEILALVGPSGAGKSTLLRLLNFLETPAAGSITFMGQRITNGSAPLEVAPPGDHGLSAAGAAPHQRARSMQPTVCSCAASNRTAK